MICSTFHHIVMTGLDPVIHGTVAAREDVDGRIKSGHDEEWWTFPKCDHPALRGRIRVGAAAPPLPIAAAP
jgi:hypothetical protein